MKLNISKEECLRLARAEGDYEIGAGALAMDPEFPTIPPGVTYSAEHDNFYCDNHGMGEGFYLEWRDYKALFPKHST